MAQFITDSLKKFDTFFFFDYYFFIFVVLISLSCIVFVFLLMTLMMLKCAERKRVKIERTTDLIVLLNNRKTFFKFF